MLQRAMGEREQVVEVGTLRGRETGGRDPVSQAGQSRHFDACGRSGGGGEGDLRDPRRVCLSVSDHI
ncbi:hypothetical protein SVIO_110640 [Streptomyces violaceusniger]|uniref:Uncharacterized protein n=1 Tax=Streptomyces violaceusniger TaxID=68280 RepID=A0A4D4LFL8_STRVO|nr:hypothetical protein SVIO_110640 [Streptomyces violaceusniger]